MDRGISDQGGHKGSLQGMRVLVAEDEFLVACMLESFLADEGASVTLAQDGQDALEAAEAEQFDLLLTDMRMPRMDGAALIRRLQASQPWLPIMILTSHAPKDWQRLLGTSRAPLLLMEKPLALNELALRMREMVAAG
jgi:CheY-like chemotaxis protein